MRLLPPSSSGGSRTAVLASLLDVAPTILDWMQVRAPFFLFPPPPSLPPPPHAPGAPTPQQVPFVPYPLNGHTVTLRGKSLLPFVAAQSQVRAAGGVGGH